MDDKKKLKLVLGTVQLGMKYGINNFSGKPSREESLKILNTAFDSGINIFDTHSVYGDAEDILGEFIRKRGIQKEVKIISKLTSNIFNGNESEEEIRNTVLQEVRKSLNRLSIDKLYGYLLHTPEYVYNNKIILALKHCKELGLIENFGVSIYEEEDALYAAKLPCDFIQIPYNIFDQRLNKTDFFETCKKNHVVVFARSAFLQGLILMEHDKIPEHLSESKDHLNEFDKIISKCGLLRLEASILFSYNNPYIDYVVFGVDNNNQLEEDIKIVEEKNMPKECLQNLENRFINIKKSIIFPSLWKKQ